jgi:hypothetical protein
MPRIYAKEHIRVKAHSTVDPLRAAEQGFARMADKTMKTMMETETKTGTKTKTKTGTKTKTKTGTKTKTVVLLSGGNPQIAKAEGDVPVQQYIAALPSWKRELGARLDALIVRSVPKVQKAVKWNSPFYGIEGQGWFLSFHAFTRYLKLTFFRGTALRPVPPGASKSRDVRYLDMHEGDVLDEKQLASWLKQAAKLPGWSP